MQSVSDDNVWKRLLEQPRFEPAAKGVYSDWEDVISSGRAFQVFGPATGKAQLAKWLQFSLVVMLLGMSIKLLYIELG